MKLVEFLVMLWLTIAVISFACKGVCMAIEAIKPRAEYRMTQEECRDAKKQQWNANGQEDFRISQEKGLIK